MSRDPYSGIWEESKSMSAVVGHYFVSGADGQHWFCRSYDPNQGYWMESVEIPQKPAVCISTRAISRTWWRIEETASGRFFTALGGWSGEKRFARLKMRHKESLSVSRKIR